MRERGGGGGGGADGRSGPDGEVGSLRRTSNERLSPFVSNTHDPKCKYRPRGSDAQPGPRAGSADPTDRSWISYFKNGVRHIARSAGTEKHPEPSRALQRRV